VTVQLERPPSREVRSLRSPVVAGVVASAWAVALGLAVAVLAVMVVWLTGPHGDSNPVDAVRAGVLSWLYANHATLRIGDADVTLVPLGALLLPSWLLFRYGRWSGRVSVDAAPAAVAATATMTVAYAGAAGMLASATMRPGSQATVSSSVVGAGLIALVVGGSGVLTGARLWLRPSPPAVEALRGAAAGLAVLVGGGALLVAGTLLAHLGRLVDVTRALQAGPAGGLGLLLLQVLAVPSAVVWACAYAVGPGFSVGLGTAVSPSGVHLGPVPDLPLLAGLPGTGPAPAASLLALVLAPTAGLVIGLLAARRPAVSPGSTAAGALASGVLAGLGLGLLAVLSSGSVGAVRLTDLGPDGLTVATVAALEVGAVAALVAYEGSRHRVLLARLARRVARWTSRLRPARPGQESGRR
jgi:hypothetical protein